MTQIGTAYVEVKPDLSGFSRSVGRELDGAKSGLKSQMSGFAKSAAAGLAAGAAVGVGLIAKNAITAASDINESLSKNDKLFGRYAKGVEKFASSSAKSYGISKKAALEYTGVFGNLFRALGQSEKAASGNSVQLTKLAADMASFNNTSVEDALEAIRSGLVGETEPLRKFGVNMNDATLKAQALKMGLIDNTKEALGPQTKAMAASALITAQTAQAHGDFARTSDGLANQQKILKARFDDASAALGARLLPFALQVVGALNDLITSAQNGTGVFGYLRAAIQIIGDAISAVISPIRSLAGEILGSKTAMLAIAGAAGVVAASFAGVAVANIAAAGVRALATAMLYLRSPMLAIALLVNANPFAILVTALAALTAGFIIAYRESASFRRAVDGIAATVSNVAGRVWAAAQSVGSAIVNGVIDGVSYLYGALKSILEGTLVAVLTSLNPFSPVSHGGEKYIGRPLAEGALKGWVTGSAPLPETLSNTVRAAVERARQTVDGLRSKFASAFSALTSDALAAFDAVMGKLRTSAEITLDTDAFNRQVKSLADGVTSAKNQLAEALSAHNAFSPAALDERLSPLRDRLDEIVSDYGDKIDGLNSNLADAIAARDGLTQTKGRTVFDETFKKYVTTGGESDADFAKRKAKAEKAVTDAQDAIAKAEKAHVKAVKAAQDAITKETEAFDREQVQAAKDVATARTAIADAEYEQRRFGIEQESKRSRLELDGDIALRRRHFSERLDALAASLTREGSTHKEARTRILALLKSFGVDYRAAGGALGGSFVEGLKESVSGASGGAAAIRKGLQGPLTVPPGLKPDTPAKTGGGSKGSGGKGGGVDVPKVDSPLDGVSDKVNEAVDKIKAKISELAGPLRAAKQWIKDALASPLAGDIARVFGDAKTVVVDIVTAIADTASYIWRNFGGTLTDVVTTQFAAVAGVISGAFTIIKGIIDVAVGVFTGDWQRAWDGIKGIVSGVWDIIVALIKGAWEQLKNAVEIGVTAVGIVLSEAWRIIKDAVSSAWDWVRDKITGALRGARDTAGEILTGIWNRVTGAWDSVKSSTSSAWNTVRDGILGALRDVRDKAKDIVDDLKDKVVGIFDKIVGSAKDFAGDIKDKIVNGLKGGVNAVIGFLNSIIDKINGAFGFAGVKLGKIKELATGGSFSRAGVDEYATGGQVRRGTKLTRPMIMMGEEAPAHPEFVIPTNPAYRGRALGLYQQLGNELGVQAYRDGGVLGDGPLAKASGIIDVVKGTVQKIGGALAGQIGNLIGPLPDPADYMPSWIVGMGHYVVAKVGGWIKDRFSSLLSLGGDASKLPEGGLGRVSAMLDRMDDINAKHFDYKYGGGHSSFAGPYDCSGLVSAILNAGGFLGSPITTDGLKVFGEGGDGNVITIGVRGSTGENAHTMMRIGNKYLESGGSNGGAKWVGGWDGNFPIHRHPVGFAKGGVFDRLGLTDPNSPNFIGWGLAKGGQLSAPFVGSYKNGGVVPRDGLAYVHQGETITPANTTVEVNFRDDRLKDLIEVVVVENGRRQGAMMRAGVI